VAMRLSKNIFNTSSPFTATDSGSDDKIGAVFPLFSESELEIVTIPYCISSLLE